MRVQVLLLLLLLTAGSAATKAWAASRVSDAAKKRPAKTAAQTRKSGAGSAKAAARAGSTASAGKAAVSAGQSARGARTAAKRPAAARKSGASARRRAAQPKEPQFEPYVIQNWPPEAVAALPTVWREVPPPPPLPGNCRVCETWLLATAYQQIGIRYRLGGTRPETGFDCSGLMKYLFETNFSIALPPTAPQQFQYGLRVEKWELEPGDLVFFRTRRGWHVGMYVGDDSFIHAPNRRKTVRVSPLFSDPYWRRAYVGARRVLVPEQPMMLAAEEATSNSNNNN
ncbi:MAG: hypothetical protein KatS3mg005_3974 [Bryobacteraceae bacterium]|nr:MAG: hypothetical protein KatS3mg005_3974 [Bryobacteraceae bacterium]